MKAYNLQRIESTSNGDDPPYNAFTVKYNIPEQDKDRFTILESADTFPNAFKIDSFNTDRDTTGLDSSFYSNRDIYFKYAGFFHEEDPEDSDLVTKFAASVKIFKKTEKGKAFCVVVLLHAPYKHEGNEFDSLRCGLKAFGVITSFPYLYAGGSWPDYTRHQEVPEGLILRNLMHQGLPKQESTLKAEQISKILGLGDMSMTIGDFLNAIATNPTFGGNIGNLLKEATADMCNSGLAIGDPELGD